MKRRLVVSAINCCAAVLIFALKPSLFGQAAPAPAAVPATTSTAGENAAASMTPITAPTPQEVVHMNPFVVTADEAKGYQATSTLAGTRLRTDLRDVGSAISVVTEQFLQDTGATNSLDLLVLTPDTQIGTTRGNYSAMTNLYSDRDTNELGFLTRENTNTRVRGLSSADNTRNYFLTDIPWDSYNTGRVDLQRGPNSILFGLGNPSGIINNTPNDATFREGGDVETRFGSYGSYRGSLDYNHVLLPNELAIRVNSLFNNTEYQERPAFAKDKRVYGAIRWDPKFLAKNGMHTSFRANFEAGDVQQSMPRVMPPIDRITPWWNTTPTSVPVSAQDLVGNATATYNTDSSHLTTYPAIAQGTYNNWYADNYLPSVPGSGITNTNGNVFITVNGQKVGNPAYQPGINEIYNTGVFIFYPDFSSTAQQTGIPSIISQSSRTEYWAINSNGVRNGSISGIPFSRILALSEPWKVAAGQNLAFYSAYQSPDLTDPSIFDFYNQLLDGPNKPASRDFHAVNADLSQTFFNNRMGFDVSVDQQKYRDRQDAVYDSRNQMITIDVNQTLPNNAPNPNVGRAELVGKGEGTGTGLRTARQSFRTTAFADLHASDFIHNKFLTFLLGDHTFTGLYETDRTDKENRKWNRFMLDPGFATLTGQSTLFSSRVVMTDQYISGDLRNVSSPAGLHLSAPTATINPTSTLVTYFDSHWTKPTNPSASGYVNPAAAWVNPFNGATSTQANNPANYIGWTTYNAQVLNSVVDGPSQLTSSATMNRNQITTKAFVWQGHMFDGTIVPIFGYRQDTNKVYSVTAPVTADGVADVTNPNYGFTTPLATGTTEIRSWSLVVHTPKFLQKRLPWDTDLSLMYNHSTNFNPSDVGRQDMFGNFLAPSQGVTQDYGFLLETLKGKLSLKVDWYRTRVANSSYSWSGTSWILTEEARAWVMAKRFQAGLTGDPAYSGSGYNYGTTINGVFTQTPDDLAQQAADVKLVLDNYPTQIFAACGIPAGQQPPDAQWQNAAYNMSPPYETPPPGLTATRDTFSKGTEYELNFNPTKNWTIYANASKTAAVTTNNLGDLVSWLAVRNAFWIGPAGHLRLYSGSSTSGTLGSDWSNNLGNSFVAQLHGNGSNVLEIPKWMFNVVTKYSFDHGFLKGSMVGGSYSWISKTGIGYAYTYQLNPDGTYTEIPDLSRPAYGPANGTIGLFCSYERKIFNGLGWRIQLNLRNAFGKDKLIPVTVQPDGVTFAGYRIKEGQTWTLTNTFTF
jgi:outer membrane receptor for ferric coprogen and ferric-rhodotorulic acid